MSRITYINKYDKQLDQAKEVVRVYHEIKDYRQAFKKVNEMYKKAHSLTDQSKENEPNIENYKSIIPLGTDIDNDQVYIEETGEVLRDLI